MVLSAVSPGNRAPSREVNHLGLQFLVGKTQNNSLSFQFKSMLLNLKLSKAVLWFGSWCCLDVILVDSICPEEHIQYSEAPFALLWYSYVWERGEIIHTFSLFLWCVLYGNSCATTYQLPGIVNISWYKLINFG